MKAKLKSQTKDSSVSIGTNPWDGTTTINGISYEPDKEYEITKDIFKTGLFTEVKAKTKKDKKNE